jgi:hypothetical protein
MQAHGSNIGHSEVSRHPVEKPWYYGWGIRLTPRGMMLSVSGFHTVQITLRTGKKYLIGTDVPQELEEAIGQAIRYRQGLHSDIRRTIRRAKHVRRKPAVSNT